MAVEAMTKEDQRWQQELVVTVAILGALGMQADAAMALKTAAGTATVTNAGSPDRSKQS